MYRCSRFFFMSSNIFLPKANFKMSCLPIPTVTWNAVLHLLRSNSYCKYKYNIEVETALNKQIESEQNAAFTYLNMAVNFLHPSISYSGFGGYFMKMYEEELKHMKILINYQIIRGGMPIFKFNGVDPIHTNKTLLEAFNLALEMEWKVTQQLEKLIKTAEAAEDYQTTDFITSKFLLEQMYAINELSNQITKLNRLCDNKAALDQLDIKLGQEYPYSLKI